MLFRSCRSFGDARPYLVALICPNFDTLGRWADRAGLRFHTNTDLVGLPEVVELISARVARINQSFARFSQIKKFAILDQPLTEETGELTPSLKIKRRVVAARYGTQIASLYEGEKRT